MALSGLDIYKLLPKTNCKECGFATCLAFAMAMAQKKVPLDKCPTVSAEAKLALESASQPPIKLVTIGTGDTKLEMGNETVMFRHEQKFFHPTGIGILVEDTLGDAELRSRMEKIGKLVFERVGLTIRPELVCIKNSSRSKDKFVNSVKIVASLTSLNLALFTGDQAAVDEALTVIAPRRPLVIWSGEGNIEAFIDIAKKHKTPLAITSNDLDEAAKLTDLVKKAGVEEIVLNFKDRSQSERIQDITYARRSALKKGFRALGYPAMAFTDETDPGLELCEAVSYVSKYAGLVIIKNCEKEFLFPLLVTRQDIYTDPQKPVQVTPKIYEIGKVNSSSPVIVTTNFSITYFTVAGEVEESKVPTFIICCDAEGMSVLTAWAADKFSAERITDTLKRSGIEQMVTHRKIIIPGYVSVLSGKLEEVSGWKVLVGPREASGIPGFLRGWK
ncbi:MAG: acetyl-CoA decarbonylase/synthase complex subunit gamma [Candidatus Omnitrophota bacterium]|jgi:acetyl-CoA decarbonylase/synthase complex subunit gamma